MGHDITGYANGVEVAYLRRSASNDQARDIYRYLKAEDYDAGVSGRGATKQFTREQVKAALEQVPQDENHNHERQFLQNLLDSNQPTVNIDFF